MHAIMQRARARGRRRGAAARGRPRSKFLLLGRPPAANLAAAAAAMLSREVKLVSKNSAAGTVSI